MQAPYVFHSEARRNAAVRECDVCEKPLKGQKERFCSDRCRSVADENARQAIRRVKVLLNLRSHGSRSAAMSMSFTPHFESLSTSLVIRREQNAAALDELDLLLTRKGPNHSHVRAFARARADAIRLAFECNPSIHPEDLRHYARALEVLRDSGLEDTEGREALINFGWDAVSIYHTQRDWLNLARSLQALANTYRMYQDETWPKRLTRYAWWILSEKFSHSRDSNVLTIVHHAALFDLRLFRDVIEPKEAERRRQQITELAERVDTPTIWCDTHQEFVGYFAKGQQYDQAQKELRAMQESQALNPRPTTYGATTLLRPEIEICLGTGKKSERERGIYLIETQYLDLYKKDRHAYSYQVLMKWKRRYNLSLDPPKPVYTSPLLLNLPR